MSKVDHQNKVIFISFSFRSKPSLEHKRRYFEGKSMGTIPLIDSFRFLHWFTQWLFLQVFITFFVNHWVIYLTDSSTKTTASKTICASHQHYYETQIKLYKQQYIFPPHIKLWFGLFAKLLKQSKILTAEILCIICIAIFHGSCTELKALCVLHYLSEYVPEQFFFSQKNQVLSDLLW